MRAFVSLIFAGASFPLVGVMVLRMNLMQLRYTLMHGLLLGGALALALDLPSLPIYILMCLATSVLVLVLGKGRNMNLGIAASFLMVVSVAIAAVITQVAAVPSKDTLELLWGSPFTIRPPELAAFVFFDRDVALAQGRRAGTHETFMVFMTAFTVALSMRFVGALLIDALLILPAVVALKRARSLRSLFIAASLTGLVAALAGFLLSLALDMPPSSMIALASAALYVLTPKRK